MSTKSKDTFTITSIILEAHANSSASERNLEAALKEFTTTAQNKGFAKVDALISPDFLKFENKEFTISIPGRLICQEVPLTEKALLAQLVKNDLYQEFTLLNAIKKAGEAVEKGLMDGKYPRPISIYLDNKKDGKTWKVYLSQLSNETLTLVVIECQLGAKENPGAFGSVGKRVVAKEKPAE